VTKPRDHALAMSYDCTEQTTQTTLSEFARQMNSPLPFPSVRCKGVRDTPTPRTAYIADSSSHTPHPSYTRMWCTLNCYGSPLKTDPQGQDRAQILSRFRERRKNLRANKFFGYKFARSQSSTEFPTC